jgi:hypothetical protein
MSVRHALLALLSEGPKYGLQLRDEYEAVTGDVWPLKVGQVYTTLQRLEREGLVESDDAVEGERQKSYRITAPDEMNSATGSTRRLISPRSRATSSSPRCSWLSGCQASTFMT